MSQLRSFKAYGQTTPYRFLNDAGQAMATTLADLDGNIAAGSKWLQIHDKATALAGGEVPLKSFNAGAAAGPLPSLFQTLGPVSILNGLIIAISSTEGTYTADSTSYDVFGEVEEWEPQNVDVLGTQVTGDLTTTLNTRTLWADGAGPHTIYKVVVNEKLGTKCFVIIQPWASNSIAPQFVIPLAASATLTLNFGVSGIVPIMFNRAISSAITTYNGGYIFLADAAADGINFTVPYTLSSNRGTIKAWWV